MADSATEFLLGNLKQLVVYNAGLISGVKDQVDSLCNELRLLAAFVKDATEKRSSYTTVKELVRQIRVAVYEAEDVVDTFVVHAAVQKARTHLEKAFHIIDYPAKLRSVAKDIESIRNKVKNIYDNRLFGFEALAEQPPSTWGGKRAPIVEEDNVVGFDGEAKTLVERLTAPGVTELDVVTVVGMGGLGKTTLAKKVYNDASIQYEFFTRAWVYVSQEYSRREVFLGILNSILNNVTADISNMSDDRLAQELSAQLQDKRYLIVLDDVWTRAAWDDLKMAFPNCENGSRILLTSRNREVALHAAANPDSPPHQLRFLTDDESWELLQKKVFRFRRGSYIISCPPELEELGKKIARKCYGLPLAIVVIAGILVKKEKNISSWEKVAESVSSYVAMDPKQCMDVLGLSYNHLPYYLKACFLYFGVFPEDFEIPVRKLIHIWVAEGFVQRIGDVSLEDVAEENLMDLVDRNLVLVEKRKSNGGIKTCRVHDMLHDLCVKEAEEENFFQEIKGFVPVPYSASAIPPNVYRRLSIHSRVLEYISSKPSSPHVRSFLCFAAKEMALPSEHISYVSGAFKLLTVLDIRPISFPRFPGDITQLIHLRCVAISGTFKFVPPATSDLWNLQTLVLETKSRNLDIRADIWKMLHLRHLYTNASALLPSPSAKSRKSSSSNSSAFHGNSLVSENLQTISRVSPASCSDKVLLAKAPNLKKLGVRGALATLFDRDKGGSCVFDDFGKLGHLETLKLLNDTYPNPPSSGRLAMGLPQWRKFPPKLNKLTLSDTMLDWDQMSILGMLPSLEVLKLGEKAFMGRHWMPLKGGFVRLKVLQIGRTDLVCWEASADHFPTLQSLTLRHCESLQTIPSSLGDVSALQVMELYWPTRPVADSARLIQQRKKQSRANNGFKLVVYPPDL